MNTSDLTFALEPYPIFDEIVDSWCKGNSTANNWRKYPTFHTLPLPVNVIFHDPATIVYWDDNTKTVVKCQPGDVFSAEVGLTTAMLKKYMGNDNTFNRVINKWLKRTGQYNRPLAALSDPREVSDAAE